MQRERLAEKSQELLKDESLTNINDKVAALTWERLMGNKETIHRWQEVCTSSVLSIYLRLN